MKREHYGYILVGSFFIYLLFNFFTKEYNWYRNTILLLYVGLGIVWAISHHLGKNRKL